MVIDVNVRYIDGFLLDIVIIIICYTVDPILVLLGNITLYNSI